MYVEGEVRHYNPGVGFGVQFVDLNNEQQTNLKRLIGIAAESSPGSVPIFADLVEE